ncbi:MAG: ABC transporter substrate-binding protein [Planctomycetota bacterium]
MRKPPRIASLLPAATETICALGLADSLVGISHECDHPASVRGRAVLTKSRISPSQGGARIDRDVRRMLAQALSIYEVDVDALRAAAPDVVVTQDLCEVCAVSFAQVEQALVALGTPTVKLVRQRPTSLADIWQSIAELGNALGSERAARGLLRDVDARVEAVESRVPRTSARPAVLTIEWLEPVMIGGLWMAELVALAGGTALAARPGERARTLSLAELEQLAPDVVLVKPCGFRISQTLAERARLDAWLARMPWPAVRNARVWIADGNAFFNRPGPRIVDSLEILAACVHPGAFGELAVRHAGSFVRWSNSTRARSSESGA